MTHAAVALRDGQVVPPSVQYADLQARMVSYARNEDDLGRHDRCTRRI
jgi:hypothetical protein